MNDVIDFAKRRRQQIAKRNPLGPDGNTWAATVADEIYDITARNYAQVQFGEFIDEHLPKEAGALSKVADKVARNSEALNALPPGYYIRVSMEVRSIADDSIRMTECYLDADDVGVAAEYDD